MATFNSCKIWSFSYNYLFQMSSNVLQSSPVKFALTLRKIGSFFALDFALQNPPEHPGIDGGMVFYLLPDRANSLPIVSGVTQIINSYAVNMRTLVILGILLYSCLCFDTRICGCFFKLLFKIQHLNIIRNFQLIGRKSKISVYNIFQAFQASYYQ